MPEKYERKDRRKHQQMKAAGAWSNHHLNQQTEKTNI